jgi:uncharacterized membrane protein
MTRVEKFHALLMVIFDWCMEPAAMKLGYWTWRDGNLLLRNYLAWFIWGFMLSYSGLRLVLFLKNCPHSPHMRTDESELDLRESL